MAVALALAERGRGRTVPNPNVGCVVMNGDRIVGRGWTQPDGRPHAEAMALSQAGDKSRGATVYTTLEPCAHVSARGPACANLLLAAGVARVVIALGDPDPRTDGAGIARLRNAGIDATTGVLAAEARAAMAGFLTRKARGRPFVTLKLALSLDGAVAQADGLSKWITGPEARAHAHLERARHEAILIGRGTLDADAPALDVRLVGLEARSPRRFILSAVSVPVGAYPTDTSNPSFPRRRESILADEDAELQPSKTMDPRLCGDGDLTCSNATGTGPVDWEGLARPEDIASLDGVDHLLVEGGAQTAAAFLRADLVDRLLLYRAPILIGGGRTLPDIGLGDLAHAHGRWRLADSRRLGSDRLDVYAAVRS